LEDRQSSDAVAILDRGASISYRELWQQIARRAAQVAAAHPAGDRPMVLIAAENAAAQIAAYLGVLHAGAIAVPLGPMADAPLRAVAHETRARLAFADRSQAARLTALGIERVVALDPDGAEAGAVPAVPRVDRRMGARDEPGGDLAVIAYTSGSIGQPRGVMVSAANLRANTSALLEVVPLAAGDRALAMLPFYHCYGASVLHTHLRAGASLVLGRLDFPEDLVDLLDATAATGLPGVPSTFQLLLRRSSLAQRSLPALRYTMISGGRLPDAALAQLEAALPAAVHHVRYGATELTAAASLLPPDRLADKRGSIGRGLPGAPLRVERADGSLVDRGTGEIGEIVVAGDHVTLGYFADPDETRRCFRAGAFHTGDLATVDADGFVFITGREREFVKSAGHRVSPQEIEEAIAQRDDVLDVAVFGAPHPVRGEALVALIVARPGHAASGSALALHCKACLPAHKVPVEFRFVAELPRTATGKLSRRDLPAVKPLGA
jgi:acyl-CoA synthetase (AMP-forming)/AMP-acid ligase II